MSKRRSEYESFLPIEGPNFEDTLAELEAARKLYIERVESIDPKLTNTDGYNIREVFNALDDYLCLSKEEYVPYDRNRGIITRIEKFIDEKLPLFAQDKSPTAIRSRINTYNALTDMLNLSETNPNTLLSEMALRAKIEVRPKVQPGVNMAIGVFLLIGALALCGLAAVCITIFVIPTGGFSLLGAVLAAASIVGAVKCGMRKIEKASEDYRYNECIKGAMTFFAKAKNKPASTGDESVVEVIDSKTEQNFTSIE